MTSARHLPTVLRDMLEVIPATEPELRASLMKVQSSALFCAPEMMRTWWDRAQVEVARHLAGREPSAGWEAEMVAIFMGSNEVTRH